MPWIVGSAPPNSTFSPAPSSRLLTILNGPGPFHPAIACESAPTSWMFEMYESTTAWRTPLRATPRRAFPVALPCTQQRSMTMSVGRSRIRVSSPVPSRTTP